MKRILFLLLTLYSTITLAQFPTSTTTYSIGVGMFASEMTSVLHQNQHFIAFDKGAGERVVIQKNDLNGVPLASRNYSMLVTYDKLKLLSHVSGLYLIGRGETTIGNTGIMLMKIDETSLQPVFTRTYNVTGFSQTIFKDAGMLANGQIMAVGAIGNTAPNYEDAGFILCIDPATNGSVVYSRTLSLPGSTANVIHSFAEISNSSIVLSGKSSTMDFLTKAFKTTNTFSVPANTTFMSSAGAGKVYRYSNLKKIIFFKQVDANSTAVFKLDTNFLLMGSEPASWKVLRQTSALERSYFANNKLYMYSHMTTNAFLEVFDTALVSLSSRSYTLGAAMINRDLVANSLNAYLVQGLVSPSNERALVMKADVNGVMACNFNYPISKTNYSVSGNVVNVLSNTINAVSGFINPFSSSISVVYTQTCITTCTAPSAPVNVTSSVNLNVCAGFSTTLQVTATGTVNWFSSPTGTVTLGTGLSYATTTLSPGTYTYYAEATTCTTSVNRTPIVVIVSQCTGIRELDEMHEIMAYPNPFTKELYLHSPINGDLSISDASGRLVFVGSLVKGDNRIDVTDLSSGVYLLKISNYHLIRTIKLIKE